MNYRSIAKTAEFSIDDAPYRIEVLEDVPAVGDRPPFSVRYYRSEGGVWTKMNGMPWVCEHTLQQALNSGVRWLQDRFSGEE